MRIFIAGLVPFFFWLALQVSDFKSPLLGGVLWLVTVPLFVWLSLPLVLETVLSEARRKIPVPLAWDRPILTWTRVGVTLLLLVPLVSAARDESDTRRMIGTLDRIEKKISTAAPPNNSQALELEKLRSENAELRAQLGHAAAAQRPNPDGSKVVPVIWYAYEWDRHLGATQSSPLRPIGENTTIKQPFRPEEMRFQIGIANLNEGVPIEDALLHVHFPGDQGVSVRPDGSWVAMLPNAQFNFRFGVINNTAMGPDGALFVKFPKRGRYQAIVTVDARGIKPISRKVDIEVY
jgi:hypothetical protein